MTKIKTNNAPAAIGPYSQGIALENLVFVSGQLPIDPATGSFVNGDIKELTRQCIRNIGAILEASGTGLNNVIKTTIFVSDLSNFAAVNEAYAEFFGEAVPARSCVQVSAIPKGAAIEIEAIAKIR